MFLANLSKNGVDASGTMAGLKKALSNAAAEGTPMSEALAEIEDSIKNASTSTEAITTATELFGSKAGAAIATAVRQGNLSFEQLGTSMKDFEGNVSDTFAATLDAPDEFAQAIQDIKTEFADLTGRIMEEHGPQITEFFNMVTEDLMPKLEEGIGWLIDNLPLVGGAIATLTAAVVAFKTAAAIGSIINLWKEYEVASKLAAAGQWLVNAAMSANPIGILITAIAALVAAFIYLWNTSEDFRNFWLGLWENIKEIVNIAIEAIKAFFTPLVEFFKAIWEQIKEPVLLLIDLIVLRFQLMVEAIRLVITKLAPIFINAWNKIKETFSGVKAFFVTVFQGAVDAVKLIINGLVGIVKSVINTIIRGINAFINALNRIEIPDWVPGIGGAHLSIPNIPELAKGGVLKKGQVGYLEGSGAEAVVPLENNKRWISATAQALKVALKEEGLIAAGGAAQPAAVTNNFNFTQNNTSPKALDALEIYRQTNSLLFNAEAKLANV